MTKSCYVCESNLHVFLVCSNTFSSHIFTPGCKFGIMVSRIEIGERRDDNLVGSVHADSI